ncbi:hypothetical protein ACQE98_03535 [Ornithinimicrobium sp. W1679]|uniref:hypothetical protein n=1 Tax=Ornithinimicrobium sp. W1679 TaxID=3418770 RepID=UPI003CED52FF
MAGNARTAVLEEAVRRHAPSLRRRAVMLTGDPAAADQLVVQAFRRLSPRVRGPVRTPGLLGPPEALTTELVRVYLRRSPRQGDRVDALGTTTDAGDALTSASPRQRAAAVLTLVEGWTPRRAGRALRTHPARVVRLVPRTDGLGAALRSVADQHERPADEVVAAVVASLAHGDTGIREPTRTASTTTRGRPGGRRAVVVATVAAVSVGGAVVSLGGRDEAPDDLGGGSGPVASGAWSSTDLTLRGWVLDAEGDPPSSLEGLRLIGSTPVDYARTTRPLSIDTRPRSGSAVFAVLWCDLPVLDPRLAVPVAHLSTSGVTATVRCAGRDGDPAVQRLVPLPPPGDGTEHLFELRWTGDLPARGTAVLATYTETAHRRPRTQESVSDPPPPMARGALVLDDSNGVAGSAQGSPWSSGTGSSRSYRVRVAADTRLGAWLGQSGVIGLAVDGIEVTDDGDRWHEQDHELRDGGWMVHAAGSRREFALPDAVRPAAGQERDVTLQVSPQGVDPGRWQVQVTEAEVVDVDSTPVPVAPTDAPEHLAGHRVAAAWQVPADGLPHQLQVPTALSPRSVFLAVLPDPPAGTDRAWQEVAGVVTTELGPAPLPAATDAAAATSWAQGPTSTPTGRVPRTGRTESALREVRVSVLAPAASDSTATVLAYEPVPYEQFDFDSAPMLPTSVPADRSGEPDASGRAGEVLGRWDRADLEDGRLVLEDLPEGASVVLTTAGRGRVRVLDGGHPV